MDRNTAVGRCRKLLLAASVAVFALVFGVIGAAMSPSGDWLTVEKTSPLEVSVDGTNLDLSFSVTVGSSMPYDVKDLSISISLIDSSRGSSVPLYSEDGISIPANGSAEIDVKASIWIPTAALVLMDLAVKDGAPLHFDLEASCGYLGGLASFRMVSEIGVPVTAEGEKLSFSVLEDTDASFSVGVDGLAGWLVPESRIIFVSGGGEEASISVTGQGSSAMLSVRSDASLEGLLERISSAGDYKAVDENGNDVDLSKEALGAMDTILQYARRLL